MHSEIKVSGSRKGPTEEHPQSRAQSRPKAHSRTGAPGVRGPGAGAMLEFAYPPTKLSRLGWTRTPGWLWLWPPAHRACINKQGITLTQATRRLHFCFLKKVVICQEQPSLIQTRKPQNKSELPMAQQLRGNLPASWRGRLTPTSCFPAWEPAVAIHTHKHVSPLGLLKALLQGLRSEAS